MSKNESSSGMGFFGILTIVFIVLKLTGVTDWNWFWVLFPITIPLSIFLFIVAVGMIIVKFDKSKRGE